MALDLGDFDGHRMVQEAPTFRLRWRAGVLEQMWHLTAIENNMPVDVTNEWRPVPEVD